MNFLIERLVRCVLYSLDLSNLYSVVTRTIFMVFQKRERQGGTFHYNKGLH